MEGALKALETEAWWSEKCNSNYCTWSAWYRIRAQLKEQIHSLRLVSLNDTCIPCREREAHRKLVNDILGGLDAVTEQEERMNVNQQPGKQVTEPVCANCHELKPTPYRRDDLGGYVCLTCVENYLDQTLEKLKNALNHNHALVVIINNLNSGIQALP